MVDTLSRIAKLLRILGVEVVSFYALRDLYASDPEFATILQEVQIDSQVDYQVQDGFLFRGVQLYITDCSWREKIVQELHREDHFRKDKALMLICSKCYWPKMKHDVIQYVEHCRMCRVKRYGN